MKKIATKKTSLIIQILLLIAVMIIAIINSLGVYLEATVAMRNEKIFKMSDEFIEEEKSFYNNLNAKDYDEKYDSPYIPEGFSYKEGGFDTGYVIADKDGNEFVWVPCTNKDIEGIPKLERRDFIELCDCVDTRYYHTYNEKYQEFLKSAFMNGGFYISRYEMGLENKKLVSKPNVEVANYTKVNFENKIDKMYNNINCELINSYAYDTTLSWILKNPENKVYKYNKMVDDIKTGREQINNIYDFQDNIMEITQEICYGNRVIRGFAFETDIQNWSRYLSVTYQELYFDEYSIVTTRAVLYK